MSERIQRYWTRFAATGNPNGDDLEWPDFRNEDTMLLDQPSTVLRKHRLKRCDYWEDNPLIGIDTIGDLLGANILDP